MEWKQKLWIMELHNAGAGYKRISTQTGLPLGTVRSFLKRNPELCELVKAAATPPKDIATAAIGQDCEGTDYKMASEHHEENSNSEGKANCPNCGKEISVHRGGKKRIYCSDACRVTFWRKRAIPKTERACANCGKALQGRSNKRKFCGYDCYVSYRWG